MAQTAVIARTVPFGRPSIYSTELADEICSKVASGQSLVSITKLDGMPASSTVFKWLTTKPEFAERYAHARNAMVERWADEIIELADEPIDACDNAAVQRARLRVDTRKWLMSKLAPKKYGDRIEHVVRPGAPEQLSDAELARIAAPTTSVLIEHRADEQSAPDLCTEIGEQDQ